MATTQDIYMKVDTELKTDDNEMARYLASYLLEKNYRELGHNDLYEAIKEFYETLL
jgi:ADP-ribosylglycohydrolase